MPQESPPRAIAVGDVVYLMSGSYAMTAVAVDEKRETIACRWFDADGRPQTDSFPHAALTRIRTLVRRP